MPYKSQNYDIGDTWQFSDGVKVHTICLQRIHSDCMTDPISGSLGHWISDDMIVWDELEPALLRGPEGSYDELDLWTGCTVFQNGTWYLFYTSRNRENVMGSTISVATSHDKIHWVKYEGNPVIEPDGRYYHNEQNKTKLAVHANQGGKIVDCRDMCVVWDEEKGHWWGYYAARRPADECTQTACIALVKSDDLLHWEHLPPCFAPEKYDCIETPDVFNMNGRWYILCLTGNHYGQRNRTADPNVTGCYTIYGVADKPEGPYRECFSDNIVVGNMDMNSFCAKTVLHKGKRYIHFTQRYKADNSAGIMTLSLPKELRTDADGRLETVWTPAIEAYYTDSIHLTPDKAIKNEGRWGSICNWQFDENSVSVCPKSDCAFEIFDVQAKNFVFETTIHRCTAESAGLVFDVSGNDIYGGNHIVLLDFLKNEVWLTCARNYPKINAREHMLADTELRLKVLALGETVEIYVNDRFVFHHLSSREGGKVGLMAERGKVCFTDTVIHILREDLI